MSSPKTNIVLLKGASKPQLVDIDDVEDMAAAGMIEKYFDEDFNEIKEEKSGSSAPAQQQPKEAAKADDQT